MDYCISDIHGCSKTLTALLSSLSLTSTDRMFFLGDYVDRGPDSKGVLDIVMNMPNAVCHMGNHEDMMLAALANLGDDDTNFHWQANGGGATIRSFGGFIAEKYIRFLCGLKLITELPNFYLCHAGICRDATNTPKEVLLWDRDCEVPDGGKRLICGHTPRPLPTIKSSLSRGKVVIDAGCVFTGRPHYGNLVALRLDDMKLFSQPNIDLK